MSRKLKYISVIFILVPFGGICQKGQVESLNDTVCKPYFTDYFIQADSSKDPLRSGKILIPLDSIEQTSRFCTFKTENSIEVSFLDRTFLRFDLNSNKEVIFGRWYYWETGELAISGEFKNGLLHGEVWCFSPNGELSDIYKYRKGDFVKYCFYYGSSEKSELKIANKNIREDPIVRDGLVIMY